MKLRWLQGIGFCYVLIVLMIAPVISAQPAVERAAALTVVYDGVSVKLNGTADWRQLPVGAVTPIGRGDQIRTDATGRALLNYTENARSFILPDTTLTVDTYTANDGFQVTVTLAGVALHQVDDPVLWLTVNLTDYVAYDLRGLTATWSYEEASDAVSVATGTATVETAGEPVTLADFEGVQSDHTGIIPLSERISRPRLIGAVSGCTGVVNTRDNLRLFIRAGAGEGFLPVGILEDGAEVPVMARTENGVWTRVQHLNGFGWMLSSAIDTDCPDIPALPDVSQETLISGIENPTTAEVETWFRPFFGSPAFDGFFYQYR